jgi:hypothetical protein
MNEERLFHEHEWVITDSDVNKYQSLINEVYNNKPFTNHKELELCRENLTILFKIYNLGIFSPEGDIFYWSTFMDKAANLSKDLGDLLINPKTVDVINSFTYYPKPHEFIDILRSLYIPETIKDFKTYLDSIRRLCNAYYYDYFELTEKEINTGNNTLDNIYKYLLSTSTYLRCRELFNNESMINIIFAYMHLNKINNFELLNRYLKNYEYYNDKIMINDYGPSTHHQYNYDNAKYIFDNLEEFLRKGKTIIK